MKQLIKKILIVLALASCTKTSINQAEFDTPPRTLNNAVFNTSSINPNRILATIDGKLKVLITSQKIGDDTRAMYTSLDGTKLYFGITLRPDNSVYNVVYGAAFEVPRKLPVKSELTSSATDFECGGGGFSYCMNCLAASCADSWICGGVCTLAPIECLISSLTICSVTYDPRKGMLNRR